MPRQVLFEREGAAVRLVAGFQLRLIGNEFLAVPTGPAAARFNGLMMLNETGAFLVRQLQTDRDRGELLALLRAEYEAPDELLEKDLDAFLAQMLEARLLEEG